MQAIILAGGKGTRLKPYTASFPKPLVPIGDHPILEVIIKQLVKMGYKEVILSTGHLAQLIEAYFGDGSKFGLKIKYVREDKPLNTAGALKLIEGLEDHFLVLNGDILTNLDFQKLLQLHKEKKAQATIAVTRRQSKVDFGVVELDNNSYLKEYKEKPVTNYLVSMGAYVLSSSAVDLIKKDEPLGMPDLLLRIKEKGGKVYCHENDSYWLDIGRVDDYEKAQEEFLANRILFLGQ